MAWEGTSFYGVHRFYSGKALPDPLATGQVYSAAILQYVREMGVDPELINEMSKAGEDDMNVLPDSRLLELGVINNGVGRTEWTIKTLSKPKPTLYLKGERDTIFGINKFIIYCENRKKVLHAIFDPQGREREVMAMRAISLAIDDNTIHIADRVVHRPEPGNGWINVAVELDDGLIRQLLRAKTVGVMFQYAYEAPMFLGFQGTLN